MKTLKSIERLQHAMLLYCAIVQVSPVYNIKLKSILTREEENDGL